MIPLTPVDHRLQVRKAMSPEVGQIGAVLARAFFDDPVFTWWIPGDDRRRATLPPFFELYVETFLAHDEVYIAAALAGGVVWGPPANPLGIDDEEEFGRRTEEIVADVDMGRVGELVELFDEHHPHVPHYYLQWAGVEPDRQGEGIGSALLSPVLQRCDRDRIPAYTEATSPRNRKLYGRHGFEVVSEIAPASGPPLWPMWREPR